MEGGGGLQEIPEGEHGCRHGEGVGNLVDKTKPCPDVSDACWGGEFLDGRREFVGRADLCGGDYEPGELHLVLCKAEFLRVQGDAIRGTNVQPLHCLMEGALDVVCPQQGIIDALGFVGYVGDEGVVPCRVGVSRGDVALRGCEVAVPSPGCNESSVMPVLLG